MKKVEPEKLWEILGDYDHWSTRKELIKEVTDKLKELGYSTSMDKDPNIINVICEHGKICRYILLVEEFPEIEEFPWSIDNIYDYDTIKDNDEQLKLSCQICRKIKTVEYLFDGDALKFWDKEKFESGNHGFEEIDLNDFIDWDGVIDKALKSMKEKFRKGTIFVDTDEE